jgi:hypothetical protein
LKPTTHNNHTAFGNWEKLDHFVNKQIANWHEKQIERESLSNKIIEIKKI